MTQAHKISGFQGLFFSRLWYHINKICHIPSFFRIQFLSGTTAYISVPLSYTILLLSNVNTFISSLWFKTNQSPPKRFKHIPLGDIFQVFDSFSRSPRPATCFERQLTRAGSAELKAASTRWTVWEKELKSLEYSLPGWHPASAQMMGPLQVNCWPMEIHGNPKFNINDVVYSTWKVMCIRGPFDICTKAVSNCELWTFTHQKKAAVWLFDRKNTTCLLVANTSQPIYFLYWDQFDRCWYCDTLAYVEKTSPYILYEFPIGFTISVGTWGVPRVVTYQTRWIKGIPCSKETIRSLYVQHRHTS